MTLIPLDYTIPFDKRTSVFYNARKAVVERGVRHFLTKPAEPVSGLMVQALVDEARETRHKMEMSFPNAESKAGVQKTPPTPKITSPAQQSTDGAMDGEEHPTIELRMRQLEAHNKEAIAQAIEQVVERAIESSKERSEPEKTTPAKTITLGYRLKSEAIVPYDGDINEQTARDWIDKAERIFTRQAAKLPMPGSTDAWAAHLVGYLRLSSYEWACRRWPGNRKSASGKILLYSDSINWEEFKREFILQHHPAEDLRRLKKQFQDLIVERSVREFNDQFRDLIRLINAATGVKDLTASQAEGLSDDMKRARRAYLDRPLIAAYNNKLDRSLNVEFQRSRTHRPLSRLTEKWGRRWREYAELVPPYLPTLEEVMEYLEIIDEAINYPKLRSKAVKESKAAKASKAAAGEGSKL